MKIQLVCFDLDGVLVSTKELHYKALNSALGEIEDKYTITLNEHLKIYDGLPTQVKLAKLNEEKGLPENLNKKIWERKQEITKTLLETRITQSEKLVKVFSELKSREIKIAVVTNSIKSTTAIILKALGVFNLVDLIVSNEDIKQPKPNPEAYLYAMVVFSVCPKETLLVEDSVHGVTAAINSGGNVLQVNNPEELTLDLILNKIKQIEFKGDIKKISKPNLTVLVPMAGLGSRFEKAGYSFPKPLIDIYGKPMIQVVVESFCLDANYVYVVQKSHYDKYSLGYLLNSITPGCKVICIEGLTEGAACTTLLAKKLINNDKELLIVNSDQYIEWNPLKFFYLMQNQSVDGGVLVFKNQHPKWSYAKVDEFSFITEIAEKRVISNLATVGAYFYARGSDYVRYAEQMIAKNIRTNNEYYVAPVINEAILDGKKFKIYEVEKMYGLGTPEDLKYFLNKTTNENN